MFSWKSIALLGRFPVRTPWRGAFSIDEILRENKKKRCGVCILKETVKPITDFDAKHLKGGGFKRMHLPGA